MTSEPEKRAESLFPTPNPTEVKEQAKKDPIQERYQDPDADISHEDSEIEKSDTSESYFNQEDTRALSSSPIVNANLSGG